MLAPSLGPLTACLGAPHVNKTSDSPYWIDLVLVQLVACNDNSSGVRVLRCRGELSSVRASNLLLLLRGCGAESWHGNGHAWRRGKPLAATAVRQPNNIWPV